MYLIFYGLIPITAVSSFIYYYAKQKGKKKKIKRKVYFCLFKLDIKNNIICKDHKCKEILLVIKYKVMMYYRTGLTSQIKCIKAII